MNDRVSAAPPASAPQPPAPVTEPPAPRRSPWRWPAIAALLLAAGVVAYLATRSSGYPYRFDFVDAGQLVVGDQVRIGGTAAGSIDAIRLTDDGQAEIDVMIDSSFGPLRQGTTAQIRSPGLAGVASRYIDVSPAPSFRPALATDGILPASQTQGIVDVDEVFDMLDANTRTGLRRLIRGFGTWYRGRTAQANLSAIYFPAALQAYAHLFSQIDASTPSLDQFLSQTSVALGEIDQRAPQLTDLITQGATTARALGSDNASLIEALSDLPQALSRGTATFARLRATTLPALQRLVDATRPVTAPLGPFLDRLDPVLDEAVPTFALLRETFDRPGPDNDLYDALTDLPPLAREIDGAFPRAVDALHAATPVFEFARPYIPDLVGWVSNWDGIFAPYDANGHYARTLPLVDAFTETPAGMLSPKPPFDRGADASLRTGFTHRCPGAAIPAPADHSAPFLDSGPLSNADCRPSETIGGTP